MTKQLKYAKSHEWVKQEVRRWRVNEMPLKSVHHMVNQLDLGVEIYTYYEDDLVDARARRMIERAGEGRVDWSQENSFKLAHCVVQAKFATGRNDEARRIIDRAIARRPLAMLKRSLLSISLTVHPEFNPCLDKLWLSF